MSILTKSKSSMQKKVISARRQGLIVSTTEGIFAQVHGILTGGVFVVGFLLSSGATNAHLGYLTGIPFIAQSFQILVGYLARDIHSRQFYTFLSSSISRVFIWLLIVLGGIFLSKDTLIIYFLAMYFLSQITLQIAGNLWTSWMADLVPHKLTGRYFGFRNFALSIISLIFGILGGLFIDLCYNAKTDKFGELLRNFFKIGESGLLNINVISGTLILFSIAVFTAIVSSILLLKQPEIIQQKKDIYKKTDGNFASYISLPFKNKNFLKFLIFCCIWNFVNGIPSPFWTKYLLEKIKMGYFQINLLGLISTVFVIIAYKYWGKFIDKYGVKSISTFCIFFIAFHPLYYVIGNDRFVFPIYFDALSSGIMWPGLGLAFFVWLISFQKETGREMYYGIFAAFTGLSLGAASIVSGYISEIMPSMKFFGYTFTNIEIMFTITFVLRVLCFFIILTMYKAERMPFPPTIIFNFSVNLIKRAIGKFDEIIAWK